MTEYQTCPVCGNSDIFRALSAKDYTVSGESFEILECRECTARFTQDAPAAGEIGRYYQSENYISHSDTSEGIINKLYHKVRSRTLLQKRDLVKKITGKKTGNILDVGCGTGAFLNTMKEAGWQVTGLEPDASAAKRATESFGIHPLSPEQLFNLPVESFDAIALWHVLEHVHDLAGYMQRLHQLLTPSGKLFIAVPNYTSADAAHYGKFWAAYDVPRHLYHFSPRSMKELFRRYHLKMIKIQPMWFDSFYVSMLSEKYKTGSSGAVMGAVTGALSNLKATADKEKCSSLIYIGGKEGSF